MFRKKFSYWRSDWLRSIWLVFCSFNFSTWKQYCRVQWMACLSFLSNPSCLSLYPHSLWLNALIENYYHQPLFTFWIPFLQVWIQSLKSTFSSSMRHSVETNACYLDHIKAISIAFQRGDLWKGDFERTHWKGIENVQKSFVSKCIQSVETRYHQLCCVVW